MSSEAELVQLEFVWQPNVKVFGYEFEYSGSTDSEECVTDRYTVCDSSKGRLTNVGFVLMKKAFVYPKEEYWELEIFLFGKFHKVRSAATLEILSNRMEFELEKLAALLAHTHNELIVFLNVEV